MRSYVAVAECGQSSESGANSGMRFRKLRIAWSVVWGLACVLLVVLWVRSHRPQPTERWYTTPAVFVNQKLYAVKIEDGLSLLTMTEDRDGNGFSTEYFDALGN